MKFFTLAALAGAASALPSQNIKRAGVTGSPEGYATGTTGGGSAKAVYPTTTDELVKYLGDSSPRVIVLNKEFDFTGTEGSATDSGCAPWGTGSGCQTAINKDNWCKNYQPNAPTISSITYDKAGVAGIKVASDKTLVGEGSKGIIKGKGLRMAGVKNVIIQNIKVHQINPQYVWGGDGITVDGGDKIWIDHVTTSEIGRQHLVLGENASGKVTVSYSEIDGQSKWSATCDGNQYWGVYFTGSNDQITFKGNYVHHVSGRGPKVAGKTVLHAVNNYFGPSSDHEFEVASGSYVLAEGNYFDGVPTPIKEAAGHVLARDNTLSNSGKFDNSDSSVEAQIKSAGTVAKAGKPSASIKNSAGFGKL